MPVNPACFLPGKHLFLSNFVTSSKGLGDIQPSHAVVAHFAMQSYIVSHSNNVQRRAHLACTLHREWENYARSALGDNYRSVEVYKLMYPIFACESFCLP